MTMMETLLFPLMSLAMLAGICLVLRKPLLWYFKVDKYLANQKEIIMLLQQMKDMKSGGTDKGKNTVGKPERKEKEA